MKVTRTALASGFHLPPPHLPPSPSVFKTFKFKYIFYALIYCSLVFHVPTLMWVEPEWVSGMVVWGAVEPVSCPSRQML